MATFQGANTPTRGQISLYCLTAKEGANRWKGNGGNYPKELKNASFPMDSR